MQHHIEFVLQLLSEPTVTLNMFFARLAQTFLRT